MIYLAQTDTTAGLLSKDLKELNLAKNRDENTPCLVTTPSLKELLRLVRVPPIHKNFIRKAKKTTIIYPNGFSARVVKDGVHSEFLKEFGYLYSTSANLHGKGFDEKWARGVADTVIGENFKENTPSKIYKISKNSKKRIR